MPEFWIPLHSGRIFDFLACTAADFRIEDTAHSTSRQSRWCGQCEEVYTTAQHSCLVADLLVRMGRPDLMYEGLCHDQHESVLHDVNSALKSLLPDYQGHELRIETLMRIAFGLPPPPMHPLVKEADNRVALAEAEDLLTPPLDPQYLPKNWECFRGLTRMPGRIRVWSPDRAKRELLLRFNREKPSHILGAP